MKFKNPEAVLQKIKSKNTAKEDILDPINVQSARRMAATDDEASFILVQHGREIEV